MWGVIGLIGLFCALVFGGFTILSVLSFRKKGSLKNGAIAIVLCSAFFALFVLGAVKTQQGIQMSSNKMGGNAVTNQKAGHPQK
ncbi:hypothetical protein [Aneurinibacillus terranovensis]|uniref:hypothetical protein n=1 Tax=Aneurinibacillus terranovensis TaxID=278991 RepID=UPI0003FE4CD7|nr:hypothetical protein [Aneurinibacillus terranovensis]